MKILFNDVIQYADVPKNLKSPALTEVYDIKDKIEFDLDKPRLINSIGIGNINKNDFSVTFIDKNNGKVDFPFCEKGVFANGLYVMDTALEVSSIKITANTHIGRFAAGIAVNIPTSVAKEPAFHSTAKPRTTLSGQVIQGVGGHIYKTVSLDSRYKIDETAMKEIENGYFYTSMGYPFFIDLSDEAYKLPFSKLYAIDRNQQQMSFESGVNRFLYSRRFELEERF